MHKEIERKFLISGFPNIKPISHKNCRTFYIKVDRDEKTQTIKEEVRIRQTLEHSFGISTTMTYKTGGMLSRIEIEGVCSDSIFQDFEKLNKWKPLIQDCYNYTYNNYIIETAKVDDSFIYAEVEFENEDEAMAFEWPYSDILIKEITFDPNYKMANYWCNHHLI